MNDLEKAFGAYAGARALVLGADGFIGRWVSRVLCHARAEVVGAVLDPDIALPVLNAFGVSAELRAVDLTVTGAVEDLVARVRPQITFNLAGYGVSRAERDEKLAQAINVEAVGDLARAVARRRATDWSGQALVHVGSALEYGEISGDLSEDSKTEATTLYGCTKLAGTSLLAARAEELNLPCLTARLFMIYGPGEHPGRLLPSLLAATRDDEPLELTEGLQRRDFTFVADVARGLVRLGQSAAPPGWVTNLATGRLHTVREFVETAAEVLGIAAERLRFGALPTRREEMAHDPVNVSRLRALVDWAPKTSIRAGVTHTRDFFASS